MHYLLTILAMLATGAGGTSTDGMQDTSRMNILFINIEDCNAGVWGCYGNPICKTPNIDRFASTAVRFDSAYCQAICCNPSRTSFLTGLRPLSTRVLLNSHVMNEHLPADMLTLPEMLKSRGFYTAVVGKLFHNLDYAERQLATFDRLEMSGKPKGWNGPGPILRFRALPPERSRKEPPPFSLKSKEFREWMAIAEARAMSGHPPDSPLDPQSKTIHDWAARQSDRYGDSGLTREQERDYQMAQVAVALLKEFAKSGKQFFLAVAQQRLHTPLVAPKKYIEMYDPAKIPDPPAPLESLKNFPYMKRATGGNPDFFMNQQPTKQQVREAIAAYYACASFADDNVGMVLDALEKEGLDKNTIVIFLGDHGFHLGDHNFWSKYSMLEATRRVPFIVRVPGAPANGNACREFVEFVDIVPTLADLLKFDAKNALEGASFAPLLVNAERPWKKAVFMTDGNGDHVVRTRQFSYLEFKSGKADVPVALYDLRKDPWETVNLADDPAYAKTRGELAELLHAGWKAALPPKRSDQMKTADAMQTEVLANISGDKAAKQKHLEQSQTAADRADRLAREVARQMIPFASIPTEKYLLFRFNQNVIGWTEAGRAALAKALASVKSNK
jgi:uncharacterized sulfatase